MFCLLGVQVVWAENDSVVASDACGAECQRTEPSTVATPAQLQQKQISIRQVRDLEKVSKRVEDLFAQQPNTPAPALIQITGVKANPTDNGVEVILETDQGQQHSLQKFR